MKAVRITISDEAYSKLLALQGAYGALYGERHRIVDTYVRAIENEWQRLRKAGAVPKMAERPEGKRG